MEIECPRCETHGKTEADVLRTGNQDWLCPGCRYRWKVRTVFFESKTGPMDKNFAKFVKKERLRQGMTQTDLGDLIGVTAAYISHIESGSRNPTAATCRRVLEALGAHEEASRV